MHRVWPHSRTLHRAQEKVVALAETNRRQQQQVALLNDSLAGVTDRMNRAESDIRTVGAYNEARARAYVEGCRKIEYTIQNFDKEIQPLLQNPTPEFYDHVAALRNRLQSICNRAFDPAEYPELHEEDIFKIGEDLQSFYFNTYSRYYTEWQAKFYRDEVARNWQPSYGPALPDSTSAIWDD